VAAFRRRAARQCRLASMMPLAEVLDLARWAPSGDNTQPWRFSIEASDRVAVFGHDTRTHCVYDLDGHPSQISLGALLENIVLAATRFSLATEFTRREDSPDERPVFDVLFRRKDGLAEDPLVAHIRERRVQRRPLRLRRLSEPEKQALQRAVEPGFRVTWFAGWSGRAKIARLNFVSAKIRLTLPEAYQVHRDVIEWRAHSSEDRIPDAALGASAPTLILMRWAMTSWERIDFLNRYFAGTLGPRLELDLLPGLACAAHCVLVAHHAPRVLEDYIATGRALQRFWLTATSLGLQFQPEYTPLIFSRYAREGVRFAANDRAMRQAQAIRNTLDRLLGADVAPRAVFMGRIGAGRPADARSVRLPLERLLQPRVNREQ
jgi:nitroreductase